MRRAQTRAKTITPEAMPPIFEAVRPGAGVEVEVAVAVVFAAPVLIRLV